MEKIIVSTDKKSVTAKEAAALYIELGWGTAKEYSPARMAKALAGCDIVITARNDAGELVGILRGLSDFAMDTRLLDMVIAPEYQRQGVGRMLMKKVLPMVKGTSIYFETEKKNFGFADKVGYVKRKGLTVFRKKG